MIWSFSSAAQGQQGPGASTSPPSQPAGVGECLFSLLNLTNTNTVNFISEGGSCSILYEPPVSSPKPPLCLPVCVYAHTSTHVLTNQHIVKCLCMQSEGNVLPHLTPSPRSSPPHQYTDLSRSLPPLHQHWNLFLPDGRHLLWPPLLSWELRCFPRTPLWYFSPPTQPLTYLLTHIQTVLWMPPNVKYHNVTLFILSVPALMPSPA